MSLSEKIFLIIGGIGLLLLVLSVLLGEIPVLEHSFEGLFSHDVELNTPEAAADGAVSDVPAWYGMKPILAAMVGFGAVGFCTSFYGVPALFAWSLAVLGAFGMGAIVYHGLIKPLAKQQYNSLLSRQSYVGLLGRVVLSIPEDGFGEIEFRDANGATVRQKATSTEGAIAYNTAVFITDVTPNDVTVEIYPLG